MHSDHSTVKSKLVPPTASWSLSHSTACLLLDSLPAFLFSSILTSRPLHSIEGSSQVKGGLFLPPHSTSCGVSSSECFSSITSAPARLPPHLLGCSGLGSISINGCDFSIWEKLPLLVVPPAQRVGGQKP